MQGDVIHQGYLYIISETSSWGKLTGKKTWKYKYFVLYKEPENIEQVKLAYFDKQENWTAIEPKKVLNLFPKYKIAKLYNFKSRDLALELNNDTEKWILSADKSKFIDLWAVQIQMQTKLSRAISGRIFQVSGVVSKQMQTIGAAQQRCLLHMTQWGVTLALQDCRSIMAMWPLTTIRNYEVTGQCQFSIEAGRRAPMGEGLFSFYTNQGQHEEMFSVIDTFVNAAINERALMNKPQQRPTDDEVLQTYSQLHYAAIGLNNNSFSSDSIDSSHSFNGAMASRPSLPPPEPIAMYKPPDYNRLFDSRSGSCKKSSESTHGTSFSIDSYDHLEGEKKRGNYDHINDRSQRPSVRGDQYNQLNPTGRLQSSPEQRSQSFPERSSGMPLPVGYPIHQEPSIPMLDEDRKDTTAEKSTNGVYDERKVDLGSRSSSTSSRFMG